MIELSLLIIGMQFGATACALSCLPVMTPILLLSNDNKSKALYTLFSYFSGKLLAYITIALIAYFLGTVINTFLKDVPMDKAAALFIFTLGIYFFIKAFQKDASCSSNCSNNVRYGYFFVGYFSSFSFCLPLATLITTAIAANSLLDSSLYGLFFGLGVIFFPFLLLYFFIFKITTEIKQNLFKYKIYIEGFSSIVLISLGILIYFGYFHL